MISRVETAPGEAMVARLDPPGSPAPVVFDSPHSGRFYPPDFRPAVSLELLQGGEDRFVDELTAGAPGHGAVVILARFARTYLDPNRHADDLDPELLEEAWPGGVTPGAHTERGVGLIFRRIGPDVPIYDRRLTVEEVQRRIDRCWRPYHAALDAALDEAHARHGAVWHVNWHSMSAVGNELSPDPGALRPHFVLGDLDGQSCEPAFTDLVATILTELGYSVALNQPYKGAELVRRHGDPAAGRHSLQVEINRALYMNAQDLRRHEGFARLRRDLEHLTARLCEFARRSAPRAACPRASRRAR